MRKAVFLDRDGVINVDTGYAYKAEDLKLLPGVSTGLAKLKSAGFLLIVITNQSGVARGMYKMSDVDVFHAAMQKRLAEEASVEIDRFYICPHLAEGNMSPFNLACLCRKPGTKNTSVAMTELQIDPRHSFMIGDRDSDIECGKASGLTSIYIPSTRGPIDFADYSAKTFEDAVRFILSQDR